MWKYRVVVSLSYRAAHFIFDNGDEAIKFADTMMKHCVKKDADADEDLTEPKISISVEYEEV